MNFWLNSKLKMNSKIPDAGGGGAPKTPPAAPPIDDKKVDPPKPPNDAPAKAGGDKPVETHLDFYGKEPGKTPEEKPDEKKAPDKKPEEVEPGTGYSAEAPKVDDAPVVDPPKVDDKKPEPTEIDKKLEGLTEGFAKIVKAQANELGLEGEKLDKFIALKKAEQKAANDYQQNQQAEMKRQENERNRAWDKELREDPTFGGQNFDINRVRAEKVLDEYGGEFKKELTTNKVMVRPSVMRMLARIADDVWPDRREMNGDPPGAGNDKNEEKVASPLDFYQQ